MAALHNPQCCMAVGSGTRGRPVVQITVGSIGEIPVQTHPAGQLCSDE